MFLLFPSQQLQQSGVGGLRVKYKTLYTFETITTCGDNGPTGPIVPISFLFQWLKNSIFQIILHNKFFNQKSLT